MLQKIESSDSVEIEAELRRRASFVADRLCEGHALKQIQRDILKELGTYPPGHTFGSIDSMVDDELRTRRLPADKLRRELIQYRKLRELQLLIATRIKATERIHELFGCQSPDAMLGIQFQMQSVESYSDVAAKAEKLVSELLAMIGGGPVGDLPKAETSVTRIDQPDD